MFCVPILYAFLLFVIHSTTRQNGDKKWTLDRRAKARYFIGAGFLGGHSNNKLYTITYVLNDILL